MPHRHWKLKFGLREGEVMSEGRPGEAMSEARPGETMSEPRSELMSENAV